MAAQAQSLDIPLHDIKPLIEIQEYSLYYFLGVSFVALVIFLAFLYLLVRYFRNRNKFNLRAHNLSLLKAIDRANAKQAAYDITLYGATFKDDSPRHAKAYSALVDSLESYKYKKAVDSFSDETMHNLDIYMDMIDV